MDETESIHNVSSTYHHGKTLPSTYLSADDTIKEMESLAAPGACKVPFTFDWESDGASDKKLFVIHMGHRDATKRMMMVANTHAREAITAEVARSFVKWACKGSKQAQELLGHRADFRMTVLPILNVAGRRLVDDGSNPCQRATADEGEGKIDLNRNMDVDFEASEGHGKQPFSTYQARILRNLASVEKPVAYLDLHSGYRSLMVSWGSRNHTTPDFAAQKELLSKVQKESCPECAIGSNCLVIGYQNPGEIIDHMYEKQGIKYSTLWEIYNGDDQDNCLEYFNPLEHKAFHSTVNRWTGAVKTFAKDIQKNVRSDERSTPVPVGSSLTQLVDRRMPTPTKDAPGRLLTT